MTAALGNITLPSYYRTYQPPSIASRMTTNSRYGHSTNFSVLVSNHINNNNNTDSYEQQQQRDDYVAGLVWVGCLVGSLFMLWFLAILIFKILGPYRVGFLSGAPMKSYHHPPSSVVPTTGDGSSNSKTNKNENNHDVNKSTSSSSSPPVVVLRHTTSTLVIRILFIISCFLFLLLSILTTNHGITNINSTILSIHDSSNGIYNIANQANQILQSYLINLENSTETNRIALQQVLSENFCPENTQIASFPQVIQIRTNALSAVSLLERLGTFLSNTNIHDDLTQSTLMIMKGSQRAIDYTDQLDEQTSSHWVALFTVPFTIIPTILMITSILTLCHISIPLLTKLVQCIFFPFFVLMVFLLCSWCALMIVTTSVSTDFCLPNPDNTMIQIMANYGYGPTSLQRQVVEYYIGQCLNGFNPFNTIANYQPQLQNSIGNLTQMLDILQDNATRIPLEQYCGHNFTQFEILGNNMTQYLINLSNALNATLTLTSCERVVPIYHMAMYDAACTYGIQAVFWIFYGLLCMGFFGLIIITLRSAYQMSVIPNGGNMIIPSSSSSRRRSRSRSRRPVAPISTLSSIPPESMESSPRSTNKKSTQQTNPHQEYVRRSSKNHHTRDEFIPPPVASARKRSNSSGSSNSIRSTTTNDPIMVSVLPIARGSEWEYEVLPIRR